MGLTYFKRYRMEIDLGSRPLTPPLPPPGYRLIAWQPSLLPIHADVKYRSFRYEIDANVFSCLGDRGGCQSLMGEIARKENFLPSATWLAAWDAGTGGTATAGRPEDGGSAAAGELEYCGTMQGLRDQQLGSIQNIGITPEHRGRGVGAALIGRSLLGFQEAGLSRVYLEVTAQNDGAIRLYERLGFRKTRTVYKAAELIDVLL